MNLSQLDLHQLRAVVQANSFRTFVEQNWHLVSPDGFVPGYHLDAICDHLQAVAENEVRQLVINVAVRHTKSLLVSVLFPVWTWVRNPASRVITATYSKDLTVRDAVRSRQLIERPEFQRLFPHLQITDQENRKDYYRTAQGGHRLSVSIGSRTSGFDADLIVADDIHDFATRTSEAERTSAIDYFETALCSRLVYTGREAVVVAGHRVHEADVYQRLRDKYGDDGSWTWLVLPEEYTPKFSAWYNATGWTDRRAEGELLWPERFNEQVLAGEKKRYRHEYSAIFLQEPTPAEGSLFKAEWFKYWTTDEHGNYRLGDKTYDSSKAWRFVTVDTAISTSQTADYTVCQCWDVLGTHLVLVDQMRKRLDGNRIVPAVSDFADLHKPQFLSVEKEFVGSFVIDQLRARNHVVKPFSARKHGDKETRAVTAEIRMEAGAVWFPSDKPWVADLEKELLAFPNGANDDAVDAMSQAAALCDKYAGKAEAALTPEQQAAEQRKAERDRFEKMLWAGSPY